MCKNQSLCKTKRRCSTKQCTSLFLTQLVANFSCGNFLTYTSLWTRFIFELLMIWKKRSGSWKSEEKRNFATRESKKNVCIRDCLLEIDFVSVFEKLLGRFPSCFPLRNSSILSRLYWNQISLYSFCTTSLEKCLKAVTKFDWNHHKFFNTIYLSLWKCKWWPMSIWFFKK